MYQQVVRSKVPSPDSCETAAQVVSFDDGMHFDLVEWHEELHVTQDLDKLITNIQLEGAASFRKMVFRDHMMDGMAYLLAFKQNVRV